MGLNILHLEDSEKDAELIRSILEADGLECRITRVERREKFIRELGQNAFDIILVDYNLPAFDGISALKIARETCPDCPVILVSGTLGEEIAVQALKLGAADYLLKENLVRLGSGVRSACQHAEEMKKRKQAEEALEMSEERFRSSFDHASIGKALESPEGRWVAVNQSVCRMLGYAEGELLQKTFQEITFPDDLETDLRFRQEMLKGERESYQMEKRYVQKQGNVVWASLSVSLMKDRGGNPLYFILEFEDITARKHSEVLEKALYRIAHATDESANLDVLFKHVHEIIGTVMQAKNFYIALYDADKDLVHFPYFVDEKGTPPAPTKARKGFTEYVLRTGKPLLRDEAVKIELDQKGKVESIGALPAVWLGVPLIVAAKTIGVMAVQDYTNPGAYGERELQVLEFVSSQVANAIVQKRAEEALRESELRYRTLVNISPDAITLTDLNGTIVLVNQRTAELHGYESVEEMAGLSSFDLIAPEDRELSIANARKTLKFGRIRDIEYTLLKKDGTRFPAELSASTIVDAEGKAWAFIAITKDITERKRAEDQLRQSEEQFRLITENATDLIVVLDLEGRRIYNSPSYKTILGDPASLRGTDSFQEIHPDDRDKIKTLFQETVRTGVGKRAEYRFLLKDGSIRHIESQGSVIRDGQGNVSQILVVSRDVTEKKKLEEQYLRAQRMESLGTLAGGIAHDLNNVLAPILLCIDVLKRRFSDAQGLKMLTTIEGSALRGRDIIKQVLTFARGVEDERSLVQIRHLVSEMANIMKETFPKSIECVCAAAKNLWPIHADPTQLHQVMMNLCVNARDAMPNGGRLELSAENLVIDEHYAGMHISAKVGRYVVIKVVDTGHGIPREYLDKIFDPFFTTKEVSKGTGLGLATAYSIVQSHGGFVNVYSEPGKGTEFNVYLPAAEGAAAEATEEEKDSLPMGDGELILVVDDESSILEITRQTLETFGYRVLVAKDGTEAVALYAENRDNVSVVLTDMMMPVMDGASTIRVLRRMNPGVKVIAASGMASSGSELNTVELGVQAFLRKPYRAELLLKTLRHVLGK